VCRRVPVECVVTQVVVYVFHVSVPGAPVFVCHCWVESGAATFSPRTVNRRMGSPWFAQSGHRLAVSFAGRCIERIGTVAAMIEIALPSPPYVQSRVPVPVFDSHAPFAKIGMEVVPPCDRYRLPEPPVEQVTTVRSTCSVRRFLKGTGI